MRRQSLRGATAFLLVGTLLLVGVTAFSQSEERRSKVSVAFAPVATYFLAKPHGRVDQLISLSDGGFLVRDSNYAVESTQAIEEYDHGGRFVRKIGEFGVQPNQYFRLMSVELFDGNIWAVDAAGKIIKYSPAGKYLGNILMQNPGYRPTSVVIDKEHGAFYLAGCLPLHTYLGLGCSLVHQYDLTNGTFSRSFVKTDPEAIRKGLAPLEHYQMDADRQRRILFVDTVVFKLFILDPSSGKISAVFPIRSHIATPPQAITGHSREAIVKAYNEAYLLDRVLAVGPYIVVPIREPSDKGYQVEVLNSTGKQVATDVTLPGRVVGKSEDGDIYVASKKDKGWEIALYKLRQEKRSSARQH